MNMNDVAGSVKVRLALPRTALLCPSPCVAHSTQTRARAPRLQRDSSKKIVTAEALYSLYWMANRGVFLSGRNVDPPIEARPPLGSSLPASARKREGKPGRKAAARAHLSWCRSVPPR